MALCGLAAGTEAYLTRNVARLTGSGYIAPHASALWPYDTFHDLRWVLVYHNSWAGFVAESAAAIVARGLFCATLIALAWPAAPGRPPLARLIGRNVRFSAVLGVLLSPWAALSVVVSDVSLAWYLFGEITPVLLLAPFLQRGGIVPGWWRGLPPAGAVVLSIINFVTLTGSAALVSFAPPGWTVAIAACSGAANGVLWRRAVGLAVLHRPVRWQRVPVTPIAFAVVAGLMFSIGSTVETRLERVDRGQHSEPPPLAEVEARAMKHPAIYLAGYNSQYKGEATGFQLPIVRYSYVGLKADGRPMPYQPVDTHQSLVTSARRLAVQVDHVERTTGKKVSLIAESEGSLIARYYLALMPHKGVDLLVMLSPLLRGGRAYYPPRHARTGWGIATGWELRGIFAAVGFTARIPNSADEPFIRSLIDNATLFRRKQLLCPIPGVRAIAMVPTLDAVANPPGLHPEVPVIEVPGPHGLLIDNPQARDRLVRFFNDGHAEPQRRWDYLVLQGFGAAWQTPELKVQLNPVWKGLDGRPTRTYTSDGCLML